MTSQEEFLFGAGQTAKFDSIGDRVSGIVLTLPVTKTQTYQGQVRTWPSGEVMEQLVIRLLTQERIDADDTGVRVLYIDSRFKKDALRDALKLVGAKKMEVGGFIDMVHTELGGENGNGKLMAAQYQKPTPQTLAIVEQYHGATQQQSQPAPQQPQPQGGPAWPAFSGPPIPQQQPAQQQPQWGPPPQPAQGFPQAAPQQLAQPTQLPPPGQQFMTSSAAHPAPVPPLAPQPAPVSWTPEIIAAIYQAGQNPRDIYADYDGRYDQAAQR